MTTVDFTAVSGLAAAIPQALPAGAGIFPVACGNPAGGADVFVQGGPPAVQAAPIRGLGLFAGGRYGYEVSPLKKELADSVFEGLSYRAQDVSWEGNRLVIHTTGERPFHRSSTRAIEHVLWPPSPRAPALRVYLAILGWKMEVENNGDCVIIRIDFGKSAIRN